MSNWTLLDWALIYRDMGLCPIPLYRRCDPGDPSGNKRPMIANWQNTTIPNDALLDRWFGDTTISATSRATQSFAGQPHNIGIVCGRVSGNLVVLDFDRFDAYIDWLEAVNPPATFTIDTGGGGVHCYYRVRGAVPGNHKLVGGDLRAQGGQVVAPPSVHLNGTVYKVRDACNIAVVNVAELRLPFAAGVAAVSAMQHRARGTQPAARPQYAFNMDAVVRMLADAQVGERNNTLLWCACRLFDHGAKLPQVESALAPIALQIGLSYDEVRNTIRSAQQQPRRSRIPADPQMPPMQAYLRQRYSVHLDDTRG